MDPLEAGAAHQAMPQGIIEHGATTVGQVRRRTDRPQMKDRHKAHMQLGEVIPATRDMPAQGGVMWAEEEIVTAILLQGCTECRALNKV